MDSNGRCSCSKITSRAPCDAYPPVLIVAKSEQTTSPAPLSSRLTPTTGPTAGKANGTSKESVGEMAGSEPDHSGNVAPSATTETLQEYGVDVLKLNDIFRVPGVYWRVSFWSHDGRTPVRG